MQEKALERVNKKFKDKGIMKGDLVLRYNSKLDKTFQRKFQIKWEGPFKVVEGFANGTYQLSDLDGAWHASRVNGLRLKKYHAKLMMVMKDEVYEGRTRTNEDAVMTEDALEFTSLFAADYE